MLRNNLIAFIAVGALILMGAGYYGATNFDRIVLGSSNYETDPNTTADITLQNDEYITNVTDGVVGLVSPALLVNRTVSDTNEFVTTAASDTVTISGATVGDIYVVTGRFTAAIDQQDILQWQALDGKLVVHRMAGGESALKYSWIRLK